MNRYNKMNVLALKMLAEDITGAIPGTSPNPFGTSTAQMTALATAYGDLSNDIVLEAAAKLAYASAKDARYASEAATVKAIASIAATVYGNPSVTDAMISSTGLVPRSSTRSKVVPQTPLNLVANAQVNGGVDLKWKRNGNPIGVMFQIQAQDETGGWVNVITTTRASLTLEGYAPGVQVLFRVLAMKNGLTSLPSNTAIIYPTLSSSAPLQLAA